jgi:hypothetical protein
LCRDVIEEGLKHHCYKLMTPQTYVRLAIVNLYVDPMNTVSFMQISSLGREDGRRTEAAVLANEIESRHWWSGKRNCEFRLTLWMRGQATGSGRQALCNQTCCMIEACWAQYDEVKSRALLAVITISSPKCALVVGIEHKRIVPTHTTTLIRVIRMCCNKGSQYARVRQRLDGNFLQQVRCCMLDVCTVASQSATSWLTTKEIGKHSTDLPTGRSYREERPWP